MKNSLLFFLRGLFSFCLLASCFFLLPSGAFAAATPSDLVPNDGGTASSTPTHSVTITSSIEDDVQVNFQIYTAGASPDLVAQYICTSTHFLAGAPNAQTLTFQVGQTPTGTCYYKVGQVGQTLSGGNYNWSVIANGSVDPGEEVFAVAIPGVAYVVSGAVPEFSTWLLLITVMLGFGIVYKLQPKFS